MRFPSVQVLLAIGLSVLIGASSFEPALAEPPTRPRNYEDIIRHAVEEYSLGHWSEARFFFERAHALNPNARTLRGLGLTCYEARNYVEAIGYFKQALASHQHTLTDKMRAHVTQLLLQAEQLVTRVVVSLDPVSAELEVDHVPRELAADRVVLLDPGEHLLSASAQGHHPAQQMLNAAGGELRVELRLRSKGQGGPVVLATPDASLVPRLQPSTGDDLTPYIVVGAGGAALIAGAVLVGIAASDKSAVENADQSSSWSEIEPRYHRGRSFFPVGFALMGVGLAGVAAGLVWKLWPSSQERSASAQLRVSPVGLQLRGAF